MHHDPPTSNFGHTSHAKKVLRKGKKSAAGYLYIGQGDREKELLL